MTPVFISGLISVAVIALLGGMAGIVRTMVTARLDTLQRGLESMLDKVQSLEVRLAVLEDQHRQRTCLRKTDVVTGI